MADPTNLVLMVIHISVAAVTFAVTLTMGGAIRRAAGKSPEVKSAIAALASRANSIAGLFGLLTFISGFGLIFYRGGFGVISPTIHVAMTLVLGMVVFGALFMTPTAKKLVAAANSGDDGAWLAAKKRWAMGDGILQLLWLVTLVLMFIKRG
jgi:hypothetical protein